MMSIVLFIVLSLLASASAQVGPSLRCGGAGYDLSSLANVQFSLNTGWLWFIAPCGTITNATDVLCANDAEAPYGSMWCQRSATGPQVYTLANWNASVASQAQWVAMSNGVSMRVMNGERCAVAGNTWRETTIEFRCNSTATTPVLVSVTEPETCWYVAVIHTNAACSPVGPTMSNGVGNSFWSKQCGAGIYDLSSLARADMFYDSPDYFYWLRVCAFINETRCASAQPSSFCQLWKGSTTAAPVDVSDFNATNADLYTITPVGMDIDLRSGAPCGSYGNRQTSYHLVCNPKMRTPIVSNVYEGPVCWYHAVIQTAAVCTGSNNPAQGYCGGAGYDITAIQGYDLVWQGATGTTMYNWYLSVCGPIHSWFTSACATVPNTMFCQESNSTKASYVISTWNGSIAETATWMAITNGVQLYVQSGDVCAAAGNLPRDTAVQFICDRNAREPRFANVTEPETCYYVATVYTEAACDLVAPTAAHVPGSTFVDRTCGGNYLDLSDIRDEIGDLVFDTNPGQTTGWLFLIELCGTVNDARCSGVQPTMFCQVGKGTSASAYSLASWAENQEVTYTINDNGITMRVQSGTQCGAANFRRAITINLICDGSNPAYISSVREVETCHYTAIVHGRCDYGSTEPFSTGPRPSLSSSSSSSSVRPSSSSLPGPSSSSVRPGASSSSVRSSTGQATSVVVTVSSSTADEVVVPPDSSSSSSLSGGAIAGIVIGSVVGGLLLLLVLGIVCCGLGGIGRTNKFKHMDERVEESTTTSPGEVEMETA